MEVVLVKIVEARNVLASDSNGKSDPYVIMTMENSKREKIVEGGEFKTPVVKNTLDPVWNMEVKIGEAYDLRQVTSLLFTLKDSDGFFSSDDVLGEVRIPVEEFTQGKLDAGPIDRWYRITMVKGMKTDAKGELHLVFTNASAPSSSDGKGPGGLIGKLGELVGGEEDVKDKDPNVLYVTMKSGKNLLAMDANQKSDPFVILTVDGQKHKTDVQKQTISPQWREHFGFRMSNPKNSTLKLVVEDEDVTYNDFMGCAIVALKDLKPHKPEDMTVELGNKSGKHDKPRGTLSLTLNWTYAEDLGAACKKKKRGMMTSIMSKVGLAVPDQDDDDDEGGVDLDDEEEKAKSPEEEAKEKEEKEKKKEELMAELKNIEIKSGDYQVIVHVIEARDLVGKDDTGTSDPVVHVHVLKEELRTAVKKQTLSCVWDETLIFTLRDMDKSEIEMGYIKLCVMDSNTLQRAELIGEAQFDLSYIYSNPKHQLANVWIGLVDSSTTLNQGVQGYIRASITVVGPGDKFEPPPSPFDGSQSDMDGNIIMPSSVSQKVKFLCARIHAAEQLIPMDTNVISKSGLDAYVAASLGGGSRIRTRVRTVKGLRHELNPVFNDELMLVLREPSMADTITFGVYDWDRVGSDEVVAHFYQSTKMVKALNGKVGPFWSNLYGAPLKGNKIDVGDTVKKQMNRMPEMATCYRGRVLLTLLINENENDDFEESNQRRKLKKLPRDLYPRERVYMMRAHFVMGSNIPEFISPKNPLVKSKMQLVMSVGLNEISSSRERSKNHTVKWNNMESSDKIILPEDLDQIPDIFLYLCKGDGDGRRAICFRRFKARELIEKHNGGFNNDYEWLLMKEDPSIDALKDDEFPGNVLVRLGFGTIQDAEQNPWPAEDQQKVNECGSFQLRVHLFQGRGLPAADSNGLLDPYIDIRCIDLSEKTETLKKTRDPLWYQTKCFDVELPKDRRFMPQVVLRVMDWDIDANDFVGMATVNISDAHKRTSAQLRSGTLSKLPNPKWYPIFFQEPGDSEGEILVSLELIERAFPGEELPKPDSIEPEKKRAFLELTVLGLRDMEPYQFMPIQLPFIEFILGSKSHAADEMKTDKSKRPSGSNPNFLQRIIKPVDIPIDAFFTPRLNIMVKDTRLGGFQTPIVGSASVDMSTKVPWSDNFVPPQQDSFADVDVVAAEDGDESTSLVNSVIGGLDTDNGAGVFGALKSLGVEFDPRDPNSFKDVDFEEENEEQSADDDDIKPYLRGRKIYENDLEKELGTTPFEKYALHIGQKQQKKSLVEMLNPFSKKAKAKPNAEGCGVYKVAGYFKGLVRIIEDENAHPLFDMDKLMKPLPYEIRVYILDGLNFEPMDPTINGKQGKSDPYLKLRLGREKINDRKNYIDDTVDPDFYKLFTIPATLPGASILSIEAMDHDLIGGDDLIGATTIDLEDRLFHPKWREMGQPPIGSSAAPKKPLERRLLTIPTSKRSMGQLNMWVDILNTNEAHAFPPIDVSLPPPVEMELRVVVWKARKVPSFDVAEDMNDLFIRCWLEGLDNQETDIHWRAKKGKGSFNWRMKFPVKLGHKQPNSLYPYFHIQAWDKDVFSANDVIGENITSLKPFFDRAYKEKNALQFYEDDEETRKKKKNTTDDAEAVRKIKEATGMWDDTQPPDSKWFQLKRKNHTTNETEDMGEICISMELVPKDKAKQHPVGMGRSAPNHTPYLPPPAGRLSFSLNPFKVMNDLLGESICRRITCCLCCLAVCVLLYFLAPFINLAIVTFK